MTGMVHALSHLIDESVQGEDDRRWLAASGEAIIAAQAQASGIDAAGLAARTDAETDAETDAQPDAQNALTGSARGRLAAEHFKWTSGGGTGQKAPVRAIRAYAGGMAAYTALAGVLQGRGSSPLQRNP